MRIIEKMEQKRKKYVIFTYFFCVKSIVNDEFYCYDYDVAYVHCIKADE